MSDLARNALLIVAAGLIVAGVALWSLPAAFVAAGILVGALILLSE